MNTLPSGTEGARSPSFGLAEASLRRLMLIPLAWIGVLVVGAALLPSSSLFVLFRVSNESAKGLGVVACLLAAAAFGPGDYLRGGWLYSGACWALLLLRDATYIPGLTELPAMDLVRAALTAIANAYWIVSAWRFGRAWKVAELPDTNSSRRYAYIAVGIVVLVCAGGTLIIHVQAALLGDRAALVKVASHVGDLLALCMIAPVLPTALALRGGRLAWPWIMMTASFLAWLGYDTFDAIVKVVPVGHVVTHTVKESFRAFAILSTLGAAITQRRVSSAS